MPRTKARSKQAASALELVETLQRRFVARLEAVSENAGAARRFEPIEWLRDGGRHGGGVRFVTGDTTVFDRASVNVSQVHYDDDPAKRLGSATAISSIIHPTNPQAPSMHMHVSWTEMREGHGYWRMMADLNPAIEVAADKAAFAAALEEAAPEQYEEASAQGDRYFSIPALQRHRGVTHFYLEGYATADHEADAALARRVGTAAIDRYTDLLGPAVARASTEEDRGRQLAYHTLYLFQVLTLDRGTTSGLLVHDQNDVGILGSLPSHVDGALLRSWLDRMTPPQDALLSAIADVVGDAPRTPITTEKKRALAAVVRAHYTDHPEALALQASGNVTPPTVQNHR